MAIFEFLDKLERLRKRIGGKTYTEAFDQPLSEFQKIERKLRTEGIPVDPDEIKRVGPYLVYKDKENKSHLAIVYIQHSRATRMQLENNQSSSSDTPKFHLTWCTAVEKVHQNKRFDKFVMSRSESHMFDVEPKDSQNRGNDDNFIEVRLYPCQFCLGELFYRGFHYEQPKTVKLRQVEEFKIKEFLSENYGTLVTWKFLPIYQASARRKGRYTDDFPELSRRARESNNWTCASCGVNMTSMKEGLHCHHKNGVKSDNFRNNLEVLCALCHKNVDQFHSHMEVRDDIEDYIRKHRPTDPGY